MAVTCAICSEVDPNGDEFDLPEGWAHVNNTGPVCGKCLNKQKDLGADRNEVEQSEYEELADAMGGDLGQ